MFAISTKIEGQILPFANNALPLAINAHSSLLISQSPK
jgi:hypothetical protein